MAEIYSEADLVVSRAGATTLAIEAGKAVVFDRQAMVERADVHKIAIVALSDDTLA